MDLEFSVLHILDVTHIPVAVTHFNLCGSCIMQELKEVLRHVPEIVELVGTADAEQFLSLNEEGESGKAKSILQSIFTQLMSAKKDRVAEVVLKLKSRLELQSQVIRKSSKDFMLFSSILV